MLVMVWTVYAKKSYIYLQGFVQVGLYDRYYLLFLLLLLILCTIIHVIIIHELLRAPTSS